MALLHLCIKGQYINGKSPVLRMGANMMPYDEIVKLVLM